MSGRIVDDVDEEDYYGDYEDTALAKMPSEERAIFERFRVLAVMETFLDEVIASQQAQDLMGYETAPSPPMSGRACILRAICEMATVSK